MDETWRSPFPGHKLQESRTSYHKVSIPSETKGKTDQFMRHVKIQFEAGQSIGYPSSWTLIIISCGQCPNAHRCTGFPGEICFKTCDAEYVGLFLDKVKKSPSYLNAEDEEDTQGCETQTQCYEFVARVTIEVLNDRNGNVTERREIESPPKDSTALGIGVWAWKKVEPFVLLPNSRGVNLRITFTLSGHRKEAITSNHRKLLGRNKVSNKDVASELYKIVNNSCESREKEFVTIEIETPSSSPEMTFIVDKSVLTASSLVFAKMFESTMFESESKRVVISEISAEAMDLLLRHLYTGQLEIEWLADPKIATELVYSAEKYWLDDLTKFCDENLIYAANRKNCLQLLELAALHDLNKATGALKIYVVEKMKQSQREIHGHGK